MWVTLDGFVTGKERSPPSDPFSGTPTSNPPRMRQAHHILSATPLPCIASHFPLDSLAGHPRREGTRGDVKLQCSTNFNESKE